MQVTTGALLIRWWRFTHKSVNETARAFHLDEEDAVRRMRLILHMRRVLLNAYLLSASLRGLLISV